MTKFVALFLILVAVSYAQEVGARYLIITHDNFYADIQPLAEWKHKKGMMTKVVTLSQIGSTSFAIRSYIQNAYNTWPIPPEYLLLVGAPNLLPWGSSYSDNFYMDMEGNFLNDILAGRLTSSSESGETGTSFFISEISFEISTPYAANIWAGGSNAVPQ